MYEIIKFEDGEKYVVVGVESREDMGSCSYDRTYVLYPYNKEKVLEITSKDGYIKGSISVDVRGTTTLPFEVTKKRYCDLASTRAVEEGGVTTRVNKFVRKKYAQE